MFTNITKMIIPALFISITSQAMSSHNDDYREFEENEVCEIYFRVDKSNISFHMTDNDKLQVERQIVNYDRRANISMEVDDDVLHIRSTNQSLGRCEVNYVIKVPIGIDVEIEGGYVKIDSNAPFNSLYSRTGKIEGKIDNPYCDMKIKTGQGDIKISYDKIRDKISEMPVNVKAFMGSGCMNLSLPNEATVHYQFNMSPSTDSDKSYSDFLNTEDDPDFNLIFYAGAGRLNIFKHVNNFEIQK